MAYQSPTPPFKNVLYSNQGGGALALVSLSYASDSGAARIFSTGGANARKRSDLSGEEGVGGGGGGVPPPTVGIFVVENSCMKTAFSCTLNAIIRGSLCSGIIPSSFYLFFLFLLNLSQGSIFFLLFFLLFFLPFPPPPPPFPPFFLSPLFLLADQRGGGGGHDPLVSPPPPPLSYPSAGYFWHKVNFRKCKKFTWRVKNPRG